jgi:hypothetical protein
VVLCVCIVATVLIETFLKAETQVNTEQEIAQNIRRAMVETVRSAPCQPRTCTMRRAGLAPSRA